MSITIPTHKGEDALMSKGVHLIDLLLFSSQFGMVKPYESHVFAMKEVLSHEVQTCWKLETADWGASRRLVVEINHSSSLRDDKFYSAERTGAILFSLKHQVSILSGTLIRTHYWVQDERTAGMEPEERKADGLAHSVQQVHGSKPRFDQNSMWF